VFDAYQVAAHQQQNAQAVGKLGAQLKAQRLADALTVAPLCEALARALGKTLRLEFVEKPGEAGGGNPADRRRSQARQQEIAAHDEFSNHPLVRDLVAEGGKIREDSIRPRGSAG